MTIQPPIQKLAASILILFLLAGCASAPAAPTLTAPAPANTATPLPTLTPRPSATPTPRPSPTLTPYIPELGKEILVQSGSYSFQPILGYRVAVDGSQATLSSRNQKVMIALYSGSAADVPVLDGALKSFTAAMSDGIENYQQGEPAEIDAAGQKGTAVEISGIIMGEKARGVAAAVENPMQQFLFIFAFGQVTTEADYWQVEGQSAYHAILASIRFIDSPVQEGSCLISTDPTYGYTPQNPIKVGGDWLDGPSREKNYLGVLTGPQGQPVSVLGRSSEEKDGVILDIYIITYQGLEKNVFLYLDEYQYDEPRIPVGLKCSQAIPLNAP